MRVATFVHPCRVKSFRKAVSAVMDDLVMMLANKDHRQLTPNDNNLTIKIDYLNNNP